MYYGDKLESLKNIFGTNAIALKPHALVVDGRTYPIIDDIIILTPSEQHTSFVKQHLPTASLGATKSPNGAFAEDIQYSFGEEWQRYCEILPEHKKEFSSYFDLVDLSSLQNSRICDLGCGMGRWSHFAKDYCKELILVDFSDAIFTARDNLRAANHCFFFMADILQLPFRLDFADFIFCLGVLHHLPTPCLDEVRRLRYFAPQLLVFLYYALDNRPWYFRLILKFVTVVRLLVCRIRTPLFRRFFTYAGTIVLYYPLIAVGHFFQLFNLGRLIPLYEAYHDKGFKRIEQDVYDRFFTRIEQRVSRDEIRSLKDSFHDVSISENLPYWHFLCRRG